MVFGNIVISTKHIIQEIMLAYIDFTIIEIGMLLASYIAVSSFFMRGLFCYILKGNSSMYVYSDAQFYHIISEEDVSD